MTSHLLHGGGGGQPALFQNKWIIGGVAPVGRDAGLVIKRLRNLSSTPDAVARRCVLGKDTYCCFPSSGQAFYRLWWPSLKRDMQQNSFCVGVVWLTQSIQHLVQTKKWLMN